MKLPKTIHFKKLEAGRCMSDSTSKVSQSSPPVQETQRRTYGVSYEEPSAAPFVFL